MKKSILTFSIMAVCFLLSNYFLLGQENISPLSHKQLILTGETDIKEITMPLRDSSDYISFKITSLIKSGELKVELFDPTGEKHGYFTLAGELSATNKNKEISGKIYIKNEEKPVHGKIYTSDASGYLLRTIKNPPRGLWKARITSNNAVGVINFEFIREVVVYKIE